jgi:hypothetical protein
MGKWITVHQKHRRPAAAGNGNDAGTAGFDFGSLETFEEHGLTYRAVMARHSRPKDGYAGHDVGGTMPKSNPEILRIFFPDLFRWLAADLRVVRAKHNKFRRTARGLKPKGNPVLAWRSRGYFPSMICSLNRRP